MKSILMSIQPKWCDMIVEHSYYRDDAFGGVKKLEVRKTKPKVKLPIDVYIYCCEPHKRPYKQTGKFDESGNQVYKKLPSGKTGYYIYNGGYVYPPYNKPCSNGKVFAKFTLNEVVDIDYRTIKSDYDFVPLTGLYKIDIVKYAKGKPLYGWKIDNLIIFDKPKELSDFRKLCIMSEMPYCPACKFGNIKYSSDEVECSRDIEGAGCEWLCTNFVTRPPQSWQYVGEIEE